MSCFARFLFAAFALVSGPATVWADRMVSDGYGPLSGNDSGYTVGRTNPKYDNAYDAGDLDETVVLVGKLAGWSRIPGYSDVEDLYEFRAKTASITLQCTDYEFPAALIGAYGLYVAVYDADSILATATFLARKSLLDGGTLTISNLTVDHRYKVYIYTGASLAGYEFGYEIKLKPVGNVTSKVMVTFNANGGSVTPSSSQYVVGAAYGSLPTPTRSGYRFIGWTTSSGSWVSASSIAIASVTVLYAQWEKAGSDPQSVSVTFYQNDPSGLVSKSTTKIYAVGSTYGSFPSFSLSGYTFQGWYTSATAGTRYYENSTVLASVTKLYAHWTKVETVKPDLLPYAPSGWSAPIVASTSQSSTTGATTFKTTDTIYVQWAVICRDASVTKSFDTELYVDGVLQTTFASDPLEKDYYTHNRSAYLLGRLSAGLHTIKLVADSGSAVPESNENNNTYSMTIVVEAGYVPSSGPLPAPTGMTATTTDSSRIRISWNAVAGALFYMIVRYDADDQWGEPSVFDTDQCFYDDYSATPGVYYQYIVCACRDVNQEDFEFADAVGLRPRLQVEVTEAPSNFRAETSSDGRSVKLTWDYSTVLGPDAVYIYRSTTRTRPSMTIGGTPSWFFQREHFDCDVTQGQTYYYWISAKDDDKLMSAYVGPVSVTVSRPSYGIAFASNGGTGTIPRQTVEFGRVFKLPSGTKLAPPSGKSRFAGWACTNGKRYDDEMLVFDLGNVTMTAIWE